MEKPKIVVLYSCNECGLVNTPVEVTARQEEDVKTWMDYLVVQIAINHYNHSPHCKAKAISAVKIPITGADKVGGPSLN